MPTKKCGRTEKMPNLPIERFVRYYVEIFFAGIAICFVVGCVCLVGMGLSALQTFLK